MCNVEAPHSLKQDGGRGVLHGITQILFWQGFLPEDPEHDLDVYIRNLNPRLAGFILRHRRLRLAISWYRTRHPWIIVAYMTVKALIVHPVTIYRNRDNVDVMIDNIYPMFLWYFAIAALVGELYQQKELNNMCIKLDNFSKKMKVTQQDGKQKFDKIDFLCNMLVKFMHMVVVPLFAVGVFLYSAVVCLPAKEQHFKKEWYPYDSSISPALEITLFVNAIGVIAAHTASMSLVTFVFIGPVYIEAYLRIVVNKFRNIRSISLQVIKERKLLEYERTAPLFERLQSTNRIGNNRTNRVEMNRPVLVRTAQSIRGSHRMSSLSKRVGNKVTSRRFDEDVVVTKHEMEVEMHYQLVMCVVHQRNFLSIVSELGVRLSYLFVATFVMNIIIYGGTLLLFITVETMGIKMLMLVSISIEEIFLFLALSILANRITDTSAAVGEALYASDWLEASTSFKHSMLIVMIRANSPVEFKAPGLDPLSVKNFGDVVSIAYNVTRKLLGLFSTVTQQRNQ